MYPAYMASATPKGPLTKDTFNTLTERLISSLKAAPKLDGILLALHGAMVADGYPQADEEIVRRVRKAFGPAIPIVVTHDFHGNPSPELVKLTTALLGYQQNPHLDTKLRGRRAASIMARTLRGEVKPVQVIVKAADGLQHHLPEHLRRAPAPRSQRAWTWSKAIRKSSPLQ